MKNLFGFTIELDTKAVTDAGEFSGYASIFGNEDEIGEVMMAGAFTKSLARRPADKVKMLRQHNSDEPIGIWTEMSEDRRGLRATGKLILDTTKGRETHALMKAGALDGLSIGFRTLRDHVDRAKGIRFIDEADLWEVSVVTFPMNSRATVSAVKSHDPDQARAIVAAINRVKETLRA
jgi:HK97 family phage prohead protease